MRLMLNDAEQPLENVPAHWGELLTGLEHAINVRGEVVTAVRFDGVDQPTFRQAEHTSRDLGEVALIELETATPADLLDDALAQGALASDALAAAAGQIGAAFRGPDLGDANRRLGDLGEGIRSLTWIIGTAATVRGVSLDKMECNGRALSAQFAELTGQLGSIVEAQQSHDWLTVADILEYDFKPALQCWQPIFEALRTVSPETP